jgi:methylaspartate ammonia-lyase
MNGNGTLSRARRRNDHAPLRQIVGAPDPVSGAARHIRNAVETLAIELTTEEIARRAYQLYEARGGEPGRDCQDWFQAERELRQFVREAVERVLLAEDVDAVFDSLELGSAQLS